LALALGLALATVLGWAACGGGNDGKGAVSPDPMQQSDGGGPLPEVPPVPSQ
jgi:hypothetical protein